MGAEAWTAVGAFAGIIATVIGTILMLPKIRAEARNANAEADDRIVLRLYREIERLDAEMKEVRAELASVRTSAADEKCLLEQENKRLRAEVSRLKLRVQGLEDIFKVMPLSTEDKALLDELDRKTRGKSNND